MTSHTLPDNPLILVTGATGYIGGRLIPQLLSAGCRVRALVRDPARLQGRPWVDQVDVVAANVLTADTLPPAMEGVDAAYYLIHSMSGSTNFQQRDMVAARNFGEAARAANVKRIIYLGGLGDPDSDLSEHLRSRQKTGEALRESGVPVTEFRAGVIVGSGSISFEMIRYLTERIPIMICPTWVYTRIQPIGIVDTLNYLVAALTTPESAGQIVEIGGQDVITYREMMLGYARARGLRRFLIPVPILTPRLSSYWVHWITPIPSDIARPLIEGLRNEVIVRDPRATALFPSIHPLDYATIVRDALQHLDASEVETSWSDALVSSARDREPTVLTTHEGMLLEQRQRVVHASPETTLRAVSGLGGGRGWPALSWAWWLRGVLDRMVGGVGFRRGRRHADDLRVGDALDFWRVEAIEPHLLRLRAEMKVPGRAWLQFKVEPLEGGNTNLIQTAFFAPKGLFGFLYWYALYPIHGLVFSRLIRELAGWAERLAQR
ncbi:MAG TPA: SDR family oxidoreductase [Aggregatilinea sp.]|uniref:SDR family oxidoreductase n=1 Tax=Aggregatilinea sp. TaxID=2806333 RepID=UPI002C5C5FEC|nr:SDR family oxidoreductase [Aggregatilinea sp.]HML23714.1 SDR family oxidoreductase [Aggregatilinea sp.]